MGEVLVHLIGYVLGELIIFNLGRLMLLIFTFGRVRAESADDYPDVKTISFESTMWVGAVPFLILLFGAVVFFR